jgi:hypothetical protein
MPATVDATSRLKSSLVAWPSVEKVTIEEGTWA